MLHDISARLTPQITTIICHHMKKVLLKKRKKIQKYGGLDQNSYVNKNDTLVYFEWHMNILLLKWKERINRKFSYLGFILKEPPSL